MVRLFSHYIPFGTLLQIAIDAGLLFGAILMAMLLPNQPMSHRRFRRCSCRRASSPLS